MIGRAVRSGELGASRHSITIEVVDGEPRCTFLGVQLPGIELASGSVIDERIAALRGLLVGRRMPQWIVSAISTELGLLEAVKVQRLNAQLTIDDILPPMDGVRIEDWEAVR